MVLRTHIGYDVCKTCAGSQRSPVWCRGPAHATVARVLSGGKSARDSELQVPPWLPVSMSLVAGPASGGWPVRGSTTFDSEEGHR